MATKKILVLSQKKPEEMLCGLCLRKGEKSRLYEICVKYGVPITYPNLFNDNNHYPLWGVSKKGIGLVGTVIMNYLRQNNGTIFESLDELEEYLKVD